MTYHQMTKEELIQKIISLNAKLHENEREACEGNEYQRRYFELIQESRDGFAMLDQKGNFILCNPSYLNILGYEYEELKLKTYQDITPSEYHDLDKSEFEKMFERGFSDLYEKEYITKDGNRVPIELRSYLIRDGGTDFSGTWSYIRDISEKKAAENALRESKERLIAAQHMAKMGDFIWNVDTGEIRWSDALFDLLGYDPSEQLDYAAVNAKIHHPEDLERVTAWLNAAIASGEPTLFPYEYRVIRKDGKVLYVRTEGVFQRRSDGPLKLFATVRDISNRKRAEEAHQKVQHQLHMVQKMESVGRLAGGVAHDFNNMLSVIIGHTELALEQVDPSLMLHENLKEVLAAASRSAELTRQLLAFARKQAVSPVALDLNDAVAGMLKMLQRLIGEDIHMIWMPGANLHTVKIDPIQVDQVMVNLCINARDAIDNGGKVSIETQNVMIDDAYSADHGEALPGPYVMLTVSDNGCGMDKRTREMIFEPFYTTKEVGKGTGLGLATLYGIIKQNHGFINVYSEKGAGTTFKIYLPGKDAEEKPAAFSDPFKDSVSKGHETVLLVEDEKAILHLVCNVLEQFGYTVLFAETGEKAIKIVEEYHDPIHILVTDVVMPGMNGKELMNHVKAMRPDIKVLFMSGYTANVISRQGILESSVHFLQKPITIQTLTSKVRQVLDLKE